MLRVKVLDPKSDWTNLISDAVDDLGGLDFSQCRKIVIVPTLDSPHKSEQSCAISKVETVEGIVQFIRRKSRDTQIIIVCGSRDADSVFQNLGYTDLAEKHGNIKLLNLNVCEKVKVLFPIS